MAAGGWGRRRKETVLGDGVSFRSDRNVLEFDRCDGCTT